MCTSTMKNSWIPLYTNYTYFSFHLCVGPKLADSNIIQQIYKYRQKYTHTVHNELTAHYNYVQEHSFGSEMIQILGDTQWQCWK